MIYLLVPALLTVLALAGYALFLHLKLKRVEAEREIARLELERQLRIKAEEAKKSITILAKGLLAEELSITEACLRISWLLTQVNPQARQSAACTVFFQVAEATSHIPILDAWKALSTKQRKAFDRERLDVEKAFRDFVVDATKKLVDKGLPEFETASSNLFYSA